MNQNPRDCAELGRLITLMSDGAISPEERDHLETLLLNDPEAQAFYHQYVALDVELSWTHAEAPVPLPELGGAVAGANSEPVSARTIAIPSRRTLGKRAFVLAMVAAAAAILIGVWLADPFKLWEPAPPKAVPLAQLTEVRGEVRVVTATGQVVVAHKGMELYPGQEVRTGNEGSQAAVAYPDGTELDLSADTSLRLEADGGDEVPDVGKRAFLQTGLVYANVAKQPEARPMVLSTPHAVIRVLGTRFSSAATAESTRIEMEEGRVQVARTSDGESIVVEKDRVAVVAPKAEPLVAQPLPPRISQSPVPAVAFAPDGQTLAIAGADGTITLLDLPTGTERLMFQAHEQRVKTLKFSPDGSVLASGGPDKVVKLWDPATGAQLPIDFPKQKRDIDLVAFSPNGQVLASLLAGKGARGLEQIILWNPDTGHEVARFQGHGELTLALAFSHDGRMFATSGKDGTIKLWDVEARKEIATLVGHRGEVYSLAFSHDGRWLASAGRDRTIKLWDVQAWEVKKVFDGHTGDIRVLAFSPDSQLIASGGGDGILRIWDVATGKEQRGVKTKKGSITTLAISPDGKMIATGGWDNCVRLWDASGQGN
jgi:WD40 repeat protein